jgi:hypothetical protein
MQVLHVARAANPNAGLPQVGGLWGLSHGEQQLDHQLSLNVGCQRHDGSYARQLTVFSLRWSSNCIPTLKV